MAFRSQTSVRWLTPRMAVGTVFFVFGATMGLWGGSLAEVARRAAVTPDDVGSAFVGYSAAGILGMAFIGRIGRQVSLRTRLLLLLALTAGCLAILLHVRTSVGLFAGLFVFSFMASSVDLVMNSEGLEVERDRGRPVLAGFHGLASLGVAAGAICGSFLSVTFGVSTTAAAGILLGMVAIAVVLAGTPNRGATHAVDAGSTWFRPSGTFVALGLIVGASIATEIAATMFSAQTMASQAPSLAAYAGAGATAFALFQGTMRLCGDRLRTAFGDSLLIRLSLATALVGLVVVSTSASVVQSAAGFAILGVGTAFIVPCGFATAAATAVAPSAAVLSMVSIITGLIRIPAPLAYGAVAEKTGFAPAFGIYAALIACALAGAIAIAARPSIRRPA